MSLKVHDPMPVRMVSDETGREPEPEFVSGWSDIDQLRWKAGVVEALTGISIRVTTGGLTRNGREVRGVYGYSCRSSGGGAMDFREMWAWLNGVITAADILRRQVDE